MVAGFIERDDDGSIAGARPDRAAHDAVHQRARIGITAGDPTLLVLLGAVVRHILALRPVHLIALVRHNMREIRHPVQRQILVEHFEIHDVLGTLRIVLAGGKRVKAVVLGRVKSGWKMVGIAGLGPDNVHGTGRRQACEVTLPGEMGVGELVCEARRGDRVIYKASGVRILAGGILHVGFTKIGIIVVDTEGRTAEHGDIIALAWVHHTAILRGDAVGFGKRGQARRERLVEDISQPLVFLDDDEDVVVVGYGRARRQVGSERRRRYGHRQERAG